MSIQCDVCKTKNGQMVDSSQPLRHRAPDIKHLCADCEKRLNKTLFDAKALLVSMAWDAAVHEARKIQESA